MLVKPSAPVLPVGRRLDRKRAGAALALVMALYWLDSHAQRRVTAAAGKGGARPGPVPVPVRRHRAQVEVPPVWRFPVRDPQQLPFLLLRLGLAFVFLYASISVFFDPLRFSGYMPAILPARLIESVCMPCFSAFELVLVGCFLTGRRLFLASILSTLTLMGIIVINLDKFSVLFRNVAIAGTALAVALHAWEARPGAQPLGPSRALAGSR